MHYSGECVSKCTLGCLLSAGLPTYPFTAAFLSPSITHFPLLLIFFLISISRAGRGSFIHSYTLPGMCTDDEFAMYESIIGGEKTTIIRQRILSRLIFYYESPSAALQRCTAPGETLGGWRQVQCDEWMLTIVVVVPSSGLRDWKMKTSHGQCRQAVPGRISRRLHPTTPVTRAHTLAKVWLTNSANKIRIQCLSCSLWNVWWPQILFKVFLWYCVPPYHNFHK